MPLKKIVVAMLLTLSLAVLCVEEKKPAKPPEPAVTDPAQAGPDFAVQGEYVGEFKARDGTAQKLGAQIVATGHGTFNAYFLSGGLPHEGWDGTTRLESKGKTENEKTSIEGAISASIETGGALNGQTANGEKFELKKVIRTSPTIGLKPPEGAVVLFDGTDTGLLDRSFIDDRKLLKSLVPAGGPAGYGPATKKTYRDFSMHIEFLTPFVPTGKIGERGNSGVYLQERYEIQILDSFGSPADPHECGGIYRQTAESINMTFPPLSWQTYEIDFQAARYDADGKKTQNAVVSVTHNGVKVHDKAEIKTKTGSGKPEGPEPLSVMLQSHGFPVFFRNWWILER